MEISGSIDDSNVQKTTQPRFYTNAIQISNFSVDNERICLNFGKCLKIYNLNTSILLNQLEFDEVICYTHIQHSTVIAITQNATIFKIDLSRFSAGRYNTVAYDIFQSVYYKKLHTIPVNKIQYARDQPTNFYVDSIKVAKNQDVFTILIKFQKPIQKQIIFWFDFNDLLDYHIVKTDEITQIFPSNIQDIFFLVIKNKEVKILNIKHNQTLFLLKLNVDYSKIQNIQQLNHYIFLHLDTGKIHVHNLKTNRIQFCLKQQRRNTGVDVLNIHIDKLNQMDNKDVIAPYSPSMHYAPKNSQKQIQLEPVVQQQQILLNTVISVIDQNIRIQEINENQELVSNSQLNMMQHFQIHINSIKQFDQRNIIKNYCQIESNINGRVFILIYGQLAEIPVQIKRNETTQNNKKFLQQVYNQLFDECKSLQQIIQINHNDEELLKQTSDYHSIIKKFTDQEQQQCDLLNVSEKNEQLNTQTNQQSCTDENITPDQLEIDELIHEKYQQATLELQMMQNKDLQQFKQKKKFLLNYKCLQEFAQLQNSPNILNSSDQKSQKQLKQQQKLHELTEQSLIEYISQEEQQLSNKYNRNQVLKQFYKQYDLEIIDTNKKPNKNILQSTLVNQTSRTKSAEKSLITINNDFNQTKLKLDQLKVDYKQEINHIQQNANARHVQSQQTNRSRNEMQNSYQQQFSKFRCANIQAVDLDEDNYQAINVLKVNQPMTESLHELQISQKQENNQNAEPQHSFNENQLPSMVSINDLEVVNKIESCIPQQSSVNDQSIQNTNEQINDIIKQVQTLKNTYSDANINNKEQMKVYIQNIDVFAAMILDLQKRAQELQTSDKDKQNIYQKIKSELNNLNDNISNLSFTTQQQIKKKFKMEEIKCGLQKTVNSFLMMKSQKQSNQTPRRHEKNSFPENNQLENLTKQQISTYQKGYGNMQTLEMQKNQLGHINLDQLGLLDEKQNQLLQMQKLVENYNKGKINQEEYEKQKQELQGKEIDDESTDVQNKQIQQQVKTKVIKQKYQQILKQDSVTKVKLEQNTQNIVNSQKQFLNEDIQNQVINKSKSAKQQNNRIKEQKSNVKTNDQDNHESNSEVEKQNDGKTEFQKFPKDFTQNQIIQIIDYARQSQQQGTKFDELIPQLYSHLKTYQTDRTTKIKMLADYKLHESNNYIIKAYKLVVIFFFYISCQTKSTIKDQINKILFDYSINDAQLNTLLEYLKQIHDKFAQYEEKIQIKKMIDKRIQQNQLDANIQDISPNNNNSASEQNGGENTAIDNKMLQQQAQKRFKQLQNQQQQQLLAQIQRDSKAIEQRKQKELEEKLKKESQQLVSEEEEEEFEEYIEEQEQQNEEVEEKSELIPVNPIFTSEEQKLLYSVQYFDPTKLIYSKITSQMNQLQLDACKNLLRSKSQSNISHYAVSGEFISKQQDKVTKEELKQPDLSYKYIYLKQYVLNYHKCHQHTEVIKQQLKSMLLQDVKNINIQSLQEIQYNKSRFDQSIDFISECMTNNQKYLKIFNEQRFNCFYRYEKQTLINTQYQKFTKFVSKLTRSVSLPNLGVDYIIQEQTQNTNEPSQPLSQNQLIMRQKQQQIKSRLQSKKQKLIEYKQQQQAILKANQQSIILKVEQDVTKILKQFQKFNIFEETKPILTNIVDDTIPNKYHIKCFNNFQYFNKKQYFKSIQEQDRVFLHQFLDKYKQFIKINNKCKKPFHMQQINNQLYNDKQTLKYQLYKNNIYKNKTKKVVKQSISDCEVEYTKLQHFHNNQTIRYSYLQSIMAASKDITIKQIESESSEQVQVILDQQLSLKVNKQTILNYNGFNTDIGRKFKITKAILQQSVLQQVYKTFVDELQITNEFENDQLEDKQCFVSYVLKQFRRNELQQFLKIQQPLVQDPPDLSERAIYQEFVNRSQYDIFLQEKFINKKKLKYEKKQEQNTVKNGSSQQVNESMFYAEKKLKQQKFQVNEVALQIPIDIVEILLIVNFFNQAEKRDFIFSNQAKIKFKYKFTQNKLMQLPIFTLDLFQFIQSKKLLLKSYGLTLYNIQFFTQEQSYQFFQQKVQALKQFTDLYDEQMTPYYTQIKQFYQRVYYHYSLQNFDQISNDEEHWRQIQALRKQKIQDEMLVKQKEEQRKLQEEQREREIKQEKDQFDSIQKLVHAFTNNSNNQQYGIRIIKICQDNDTQISKQSLLKHLQNYDNNTQINIQTKIINFELSLRVLKHQLNNNISIIKYIPNEVVQVINDYQQCSLLTNTATHSLIGDSNIGIAQFCKGMQNAHEFHQKCMMSSINIFQNDQLDNTKTQLSQTTQLDFSNLQLSPIRSAMDLEKQRILDNQLKEQPNTLQNNLYQHQQELAQIQASSALIEALRNDDIQQLNDITKHRYDAANKGKFEQMNYSYKQILDLNQEFDFSEDNDQQLNIINLNPTFEEEKITKKKIIDDYFLRMVKTPVKLYGRKLNCQQLQPIPITSSKVINTVLSSVQSRATARPVEPKPIRIESKKQTTRNIKSVMENRKSISQVKYEQYQKENDCQLQILNVTLPGLNKCDQINIQLIENITNSQIDNLTINIQKLDYQSEIYTPLTFSVVSKLNVINSSIGELTIIAHSSIANQTSLLENNPNCTIINSEYNKELFNNLKQVELVFLMQQKTIFLEQNEDAQEIINNTYAQMQEYQLQKRNNSKLSINNDLKCSQNLFKFGNQCIEICPTKTKVDYENQRCTVEPLEINSYDSYFDFEQKQFFNVTDGFVLENGFPVKVCTSNSLLSATCVNKCPKFMTLQDGLCVQKYQNNDSQILYSFITYTDDINIYQLCPDKLLEMNNSCIEKCPDNYQHSFTIKKCIQDMHYYNTTTNQFTQSCDSKIFKLFVDLNICVDQCDEYLIKQENGMFQCANNCESLFYINGIINYKFLQLDYQLRGKVCVQDCGELLVEEIINTSSIKQCLNNCSQSDVSRYQFEQQCVEQCQPTSHKYLKDKMCVQSCKEYNQAADNNICCDTCKYFHIIDNGQQICINECPINFWILNDTKQCVNNCSNEYIFKINKTCFKQCPENYYINQSENVCQPECHFFVDDKYCQEKCESKLINLINNKYICIKENCQHSLQLILQINNLDYQVCQVVNSTNIKNLTCAHNLKLEDHKCVEQCSQYHPYLMIQTINNKKQHICVKSCLLNDQYLDENNKCQYQCKYYHIIQNHIDQKQQEKLCIQQCMNLYQHIINENLTECVARCPDNQVIFQNVCQNKCPIDYLYINKSNKFCLKQCDISLFAFHYECVDHCPTEAKYINNDTCVQSCPNFISNKSNQLFCVDQCEDNYVQNNESVCIPINEFKYCEQNQYYNKKSKQCENECNQFVEYVENQSFCIEECQYFQHIINSLKICLKQCPELTFVLNNQMCVSRCPAFVYNKTCVTDCPDHTYTNGIDCQDNCESHLFSNKEINGKQQKICISNCSYLKIQHQQRNNENIFECVQSCPQSAPLKNDDMCVDKCPVFYFDKICVNSCKRYNMMVKNQFYCDIQCDTFYTLNNEDYCTEKCSGLKYLHSNGKTECIRKCPKEAIYQENNICVSQCSPKNKFIYNNQCLKTCSEKQFIIQDKDTYYCKDTCPLYHIQKSGGQNYCINECKDVVIKKIDGSMECVIQCPANYVYYKNLCVESCPQSMFIYYNGTRNTCNEKCDNFQIIVNNQNQCIDACPANLPYYVLNNNQKQCIGQCETNYYINQNQCVKTCNKYIINNTTCSENCPQHESRVLNSHCYQVCPEGFYNDGQNNCLTTCSPTMKIIEYVENTAQGNTVKEKCCLSTCTIYDKNGNCLTKCIQNQKQYGNMCLDSQTLNLNIEIEDM